MRCHVPRSTLAARTRTRTSSSPIAGRATSRAAARPRARCRTRPGRSPAWSPASAWRLARSVVERRCRHGALRASWAYVVSTVRLRRKFCQARRGGARDGSRAKRQRAPRIPLSRERVLRAAVALADESGIASLTHAQARRGARGRGDVAVQPRRQQGRAARRHGRPRLRRDRAARRRGRLEDGDARAGDLGARGPVAPPLGDRPDGVADLARARRRCATTTP